MLLLGAHVHRARSLGALLKLAIILSVVFLAALTTRSRWRTRLYLTYRTLRTYALDRDTASDALPPVYLDEWANEAQLPQLDVDLPFPEGKNGAFQFLSRATDHGR